ncbi:ACT domain-containing protein [Chloropicon primus]|uniref:ACT domain-containing protein n=1 Tax=Chloropicon primus TaxID=1764295 RepID=A0A5B8MFU9_9CHLO|nr:ACT domain-containing protein [Chloropicon primus]|eukprot:QDZ18210.1 ACT domain-containing protein [Chloropicon primus]
MEGQGDNTFLEVDRDEEVVQVEAHVSGDSADVSISCSDATGLGCDIARVIFNFGLTVYNGDFSTDGRWCFVMLHVRPCFGSPPCAKNWNLLKKHLLRFCSSEKTLKSSAGPIGHKKFILQIQFQDQIGTLHNIIHCLWEADLVVHKANISTSPDNKGMDMFYVSDNLDKLPKQSRINQIEEMLAKRIHSDLKVTCIAYPYSRLSKNASPRLLTGTKDCKDSRSSLPMMRTLSNRERNGSRRSSVSSQEGFDILPRFNVAEIFQSLKVNADNLVSPTQTVIHIECPDRKGLLYDLFRITKDIGLQISYSKISLDMKLCRADLFVHEAEHHQKLTDEMIEFVCAEIKHAITSSIPVKVQNRHDAGSSTAVLQTEVVALAPVDSGFRGRPRVLYDLTATLNQLGVSIFHAEMYAVELSGDGREQDKRYQEVHRFVIQDSNGKSIGSNGDLEVIENELYSRLIGSGAGPRESSKPQFANLLNLLDYGIL